MHEGTSGGKPYGQPAALVPELRPASEPAQASFVTVLLEAVVPVLEVPAAVAAAPVVPAAVVPVVALPAIWSSPVVVAFVVPVVPVPVVVVLPGVVLPGVVAPVPVLPVAVPETIEVLPAVVDVPPPVVPVVVPVVAVVGVPPEVPDGAVLLVSELVVSELAALVLPDAEPLVAAPDALPYPDP